MKKNNKLILVGVIFVVAILLVFLVPEISRRMALSECNKQEVKKVDEKANRNNFYYKPNNQLEDLNTGIALCMKRKGF